jgi:hypothetical protein
MSTATIDQHGGLRGVFKPPGVDSLDVAAILAEMEGREFVELPALGEKIGMDHKARQHAIREGLITPEAKRGANGRKLVSADEAMTLILCAALALAAGIAIAVMLRGVKGAGLNVAALVSTLPT